MANFIYLFRCSLKIIKRLSAWCVWVIFLYMKTLGETRKTLLEWEIAKL